MTKEHSRRVKESLMKTMCEPTINQLKTWHFTQNDLLGKEKCIHRSRLEAHGNCGAAQRARAQVGESGDRKTISCTF